jgi:hypothetical protein
MGVASDVRVVVVSGTAGRAARLGGVDEAVEVVPLVLTGVRVCGVLECAYDRAAN